MLLFIYLKLNMMLKFICLACIAGCLSNSLLAQAKQNKDTVDGSLDEVVIAVSKWERKMNEVPNTIARVNMKEARLQNPQTAADLLAMTGQVFVQKSQLGGGSPMIRGFATNRLIIVVDGVRMNNAIYRSGNLQNVISLDPLATQNAEVIFGPGSIIYGSDAIGGVMDFHSFDARLSATDKTVVSANSLVRYATANNEQTGHVDFNVGSKKLAFLGSVTYSDFGDLKMGRNGGQESYLRTKYVQREGSRDSVYTNPNPYLQKNTGYHQWNVLSKLRFAPTANWDLQYAFHYSTTGNVPRYDRLIEFTGNLPTYAEWYYGPQVWKMHQIKAEHTAKTSLYNGARLILAIQDYKESRNDRRLNNLKLRKQTETVDIFTANLDLNKQLTEKSELFYGLEIVTNDVGSFAERTNINTNAVEGAATRYPNNSTWNSAGAYASYKNNVSDKVTLSGGVRYNYVTLKAPFDTTFFKFPFQSAELKDGAFTGSFGFVYRPSVKWQINSNLSTGFRVPNIDDVGKVFDSEPGNIVVPNPELASEYAYNIDLGISRSNNNSKFKFDVTVFYTHLDNAIVRRPFRFNGLDTVLYEGVRSRVQSLQNVARAKVWGLQAGYEWKFAKHLSWQLRANYIDGKETDDVQSKDVQLRHAPPFYGNSYIKFDDNKLAVELYSVFNGEIAADNLSPSEQSKTFIYAQDASGRLYSPAWHTLNIKSSYRFSSNFVVTAGCENVTNRRYRAYSSGIVAPGINFIASLRVGI